MDETSDKLNPEPQIPSWVTKERKFPLAAGGLPCFFPELRQSLEGASTAEMTDWVAREKRVVRAQLATLPDDADPRIVAFHEHWLSLKPAPDLLPGRQHFDPVDVPKFLPWLWLVEVERDPPRFKYRLVGTGHVDALGADNKGRYMDEALDGFKGSLSEAQHVEVVRRGVIAYLEQPSWVGKLEGVRWFRRLLVPFARDGRTVDMIMGLGYYSDRE